MRRGGRGGTTVDIAFIDHPRSRGRRPRADGRRSRRARPRVRPPRARGTGPDRPPLLPRPAAARGGGRARHPPRHGEVPRPSRPAPAAGGARRRFPRRRRLRWRAARHDDRRSPRSSRSPSGWTPSPPTACPITSGEVVAQTAVTRQRPWWSSLERWLPMDLTTRASTLAPPRLGRVILVGLLILALVGLAIVAAGSRQPRLPAPYGPGPQRRADLERGRRHRRPRSGHARQLAADRRPVIRLRSDVLAGRDDGSCSSGGHRTAADSPTAASSWSWPTPTARECASSRRASPASTGWTGRRTGPRSRSSPRHRTAAAMSSRWSTRTGPAGARLDVGRPAHAISWLPPDGDEIVFRGEQLTAG